MTAGLDVGKMLGPLIGGLVAAVIGLEAMFRLVPFIFLVLYILLDRGAFRRRPTVIVAVASPDRSISEEA